MKKINLLFCLFTFLVMASCTKSSNNSESASSSAKDCDFKVLVFASYSDEDGKLTYDFEEMKSWSQESTHDYAIKNNSDVESATVEILKDGKALKKIDLTLKKAGTKITQLEDKGRIKTELRKMGELKPKMILSFAFNSKAKKSCKKDVEIFID
jgi:hypothetical protein